MISGSYQSYGSMSVHSSPSPAHSPSSSTPSSPMHQFTKESHYSSSTTPRGLPKVISQRISFMEMDPANRKKRSRNLTNPFQTKVLRSVLAQTAFPTTEMRRRLADELGMSPRAVQIWFQNQRQKHKNRKPVSTSQRGPCSLSSLLFRNLTDSPAAQEHINIENIIASVSESLANFRKGVDGSRNVGEGGTTSPDSPASSLSSSTSCSSSKDILYYMSSKPPTPDAFSSSLDLLATAATNISVLDTSLRHLGFSEAITSFPPQSGHNYPSLFTPPQASAPRRPFRPW